MPEEIPHLKSDIVKPNPIDLERLKNLVENADIAQKILDEAEKGAEEKAKRLEQELKEICSKRIRIVGAKEIEAIARTIGMLKLEAELARRGKKTKGIIQKKIREKAISTLVKSLEDKLTRMAYRTALKEFSKLSKSWKMAKSLRVHGLKIIKFVGVRWNLLGNIYFVIELQIEMTKALFTVLEIQSARNKILAQEKPFVRRPTTMELMLRMDGLNPELLAALEEYYDAHPEEVEGAIYKRK